MRVAIVTVSFLPQTNSVAKTVRHVAEQLVLLGHHPMTVAPGTGPDHHRGITVTRVRCVGLPHYREFPVGLPDAGLERALTAFRPDVAHLASPIVVGAAGSTAAPTGRWCPRWPPAPSWKRWAWWTCTSGGVGSRLTCSRLIGVTGADMPCCRTEDGAAGGPLDLVQHGQTGLLFDPADSASLWRTVVAAVRDEPFRRGLASAALEQVQGRTWQTLVEELVEQHYGAVLGRRPLAIA